MALLRDIRYGVRMLVKRPGLSASAVIALALGIGLTTTMFSIVYVAIVRGLPYDEPDRLVVVFGTRPAQNLRFMPVGLQDYVDWRQQQTSFEDIAAYFAETVNVSGSEGQPIRYLGAYVSAHVFDVLRARPILGRTFRAGEDHPSAPPVMILSYRAWRDRFAGDPDVVGRVVRANSEMTTIVGVMPEHFGFPGQMDAWLPIRLDPLAFARGSGPALEGTQLQAIARLKPGVSLEAATAEMTTIADRLAEVYPDSNRGVGVMLMTLQELMIGENARNLLWTMLAAVFGVLVIACANVTNLLLARTVARTRELAVRTALGSGRRQIVVQLLVETLVLAIVGAALGLVVAKIGIDAFNASAAGQDLPTWLVARLEPSVVGFVVLLTGLSALMAGIVPALRASRVDVSELLNDEARGSSSARMGRVSRLLVVAEIALSCGLLVAAGLMIRSIVNISRFDYGFETSNILTARVGLFAKDYPTPDDQERFYDELARRVSGLAGVRSVAFASDLPSRGSQGQRLSVDGATYATEQDHPRAGRVVVSADYFTLLGVRPLTGRVFGAGDRVDTAPVALVNERFVKSFLSAGDPIGARVRVGDNDAPWRTVVGVVPDLHLGGFGNAEARDEGVYVPLAQNTINFMSLLVRTERAPASVASAVQAQVTAIDPTLPLYWVRSLDEQYALDSWFFRAFGGLFMAFGFSALALATIGLYGVMSFAVGNRTREFGVRMALGAKIGDVWRLVLTQGAWQLAVGLGLGLVVAAALARSLATFLFGVRPWDPLVFLMVVATLAAAGIAACAIPARRATRVDPMSALRAD